MVAIALAIFALYAKPSLSQVNWTTAAQEDQSFTLPAAKLVRYGEAFNNRWTAPRSMVGLVACNNATFTDPSPSVGKVCQTKDLEAPAPSPILPPLASGLTYVVRWTAPTTNTDGSPIGTILKTTIHASSTPTFSTYYQWESSVANATSVVVNNGPSGTIYWRARVETANGTSDYSATAISDRQFVSLNRPRCWPKPIGSGTWVKVARNDAGWATYWQCQKPDGTWEHQGRVGLWSQMAPDWVVQLANALPGGEAAFNALWDANGAGPNTPPSTYDPVRPLWTAMRDANPLPVQSLWKVAANGAYTTRAANAIVNGVRTTTTVGRVAVGAPCDCAAFSAAGDYCAVTGQPNVATASPTDVLGPSTTLCSR